jgi:hypothetical protein
MSTGKDSKPVGNRIPAQDGHQPVETRGYQTLEKGYQPTASSEIPQPPNVGSAAVMPLNSVPAAPVPVAPATVPPGATGTKTEG